MTIRVIHVNPCNLPSCLVSIGKICFLRKKFLMCRQNQFGLYFHRPVNILFQAERADHAEGESQAAGFIIPGAAGISNEFLQKSIGVMDVQIHLFIRWDGTLLFYPFFLSDNELDCFCFCAGVLIVFVSYADEPITVLVYKLFGAGRSGC